MSANLPPVKRNALGRGLSALIGQSEGAPLSAEASRDIVRVDIERLAPNEAQPRQHFDDEALRELAASIRAKGLLQPILARKLADGRMEIVAGERRWRASQMAGLDRVPVILREFSDAEAFEIALIENLQRVDLNPIEEAEGYRRLMDAFGYTQEAVAAKIGKDRSTVANALRLLRLPEEVRHQVKVGELSMGHARAILGLGEEAKMVEAGREVARRRLSVRDTEQMIRRQRKPAAARPASSAGANDAALRRVAEDLIRVLGTRVRIVPREPGGTIEISYASTGELNRLLELLTRPNQR